MSRTASYRDDDLQSLFEKSAAVVRRSFERYERSYIRPYFNTFLKSFQTRPIRSTLLAIFAVLSFLPLLSFAGFSLFVLGSFTFFALGGALLASAAAITLFGLILALTLATLFFISIFLAAALLAGYLSLRLVLLIRSNGTRKGVSTWSKETKNRFYSGVSDIQLQSDQRTLVPSKTESEPEQVSSSQLKPADEPKPKSNQDEDEKSSSSSDSMSTSGSTVVVESAEPGPFVTPSQGKEDEPGLHSPIMVKGEFD